MCPSVGPPFASEKRYANATLLTPAHGSHTVPRFYRPCSRVFSPIGPGCQDGFFPRSLYTISIVFIIGAVQGMSRLTVRLRRIPPVRFVIDRSSPTRRNGSGRTDGAPGGGTEYRVHGNRTGETDGRFRDGWGLGGETGSELGLRLSPAGGDRRARRAVSRERPVQRQRLR